MTPGRAQDPESQRSDERVKRSDPNIGSRGRAVFQFLSDMARPLLLSVLVGLAAAGAFAAEPPAIATDRGKTASQWAGDLESKDSSTRWYAAYALGRMGPGAAGAVPALERVLENLDEDEYVRGGAAWALGQIGPKAAVAVPLLTRTLSSKLVSVRRNAATALGNLAAAPPVAVDSATAGKKPAASIRALVGLLDDEDIAVRAAAAVALWKIDRHPKAIPTLESMLGDRSGSVACCAATELGELQAAAEPVVPSLVNALHHPDDDTRRAAAYALGRIGPAAIPSLRAAMAPGSPETTKDQVVEALAWIGRPAIPSLIEALADPTPSVRRRAARALGRLGPAAKQAEPALIKAVSDPQTEVRDAAADALRHIRG